MAFSISAQKEMSNDEPGWNVWKGIQDYGINLLDYDLHLKSHAGDVYMHMVNYGYGECFLQTGIHRR